MDERFNDGGTEAEYVVDYLRRRLLSYWVTREGQDLPAPLGSIFGPKAMTINQYAGSGGNKRPRLVGRDRWLWIARSGLRKDWLRVLCILTYVFPRQSVFG